jgi:hypothetical protein
LLIEEHRDERTDSPGHGREHLRTKYARNPAVLRFSLYRRCFLIQALSSAARSNNFRVSISRQDFCDRLINLQTAKIAGAIVPISQALQIVLAQPTKGKALMYQSMGSATE